VASHCGFVEKREFEAVASLERRTVGDLAASVPVTTERLEHDPEKLARGL